MGIAFVSDSATISTTEYSLPADTTSGVPTSQTDDCLLQVWLDFDAMVAGDEYRIRFYEKINAGTQRTVIDTRVAGDQATPWVSPALLVGDGWDVTVTRIAGADRAIAWSLRKVT